MTDVGFYHLTRTGPDQALPKLLGRTLAAGQRAVVLCTMPERLIELDEQLWQGDWLPHGTSSDGDPELQPIWLTTEDDAPNGARFLFLIYGAQSDRLEQFDRVFDLFNGDDESAVAAARLRWTAAKTAGHKVTYWQQGIGGWENVA